MASETQLGVGIVGTGWVSTEHIRALEQNPFTQVTAICSREKSRTLAKGESMQLNHPFMGEIEHFVECIQFGRESHVNVADAVKTHVICLASEISAKTGKPVSLSLSLL